MRPDPTVAGQHFEAMGTACAIFAVGRAATPEAEAWVHEMAARLTRFESDSELSRLNAHAGHWVDVTPVLEAVLRAAERAYVMSSGLVNAAVLPSMVSAGYTRTFSDGPMRMTLDRPQPTPALPAVLEIRPGRARLEPGAGLDLGGIAKGWMCDRLCEQLGPNAVVNLGGDLRAVGPGPRGDGWPVGVAGVTLLLRDQGAATSSVRRRRWEGAHHVIDPRSGQPSDSGLEEVSVVAADGFEAEVVAKTALLLGPDLAPAYCARHALAWWLDGRHDG
jgi:thiamine biosynthesis lipoprotein